MHSNPPLPGDQDGARSCASTPDESTKPNSHARANGKAACGKLDPLTDDEAAAVIVRIMVSGESPSKGERARLGSAWGNVALKILGALQRGQTAQDGMLEALAWVKGHDGAEHGPDRHDAMVAALEAAESGHPPINPPSSDPINGGRPYPYTDMGNAERLRARYHDVIRYVHLWKKYLHFDGSRWKRDTNGAVSRLAKATVRSILAEAALIEEKAARSAALSWEKTSESKQRLEAMIALCESEAGIPIAPEELDRDPWILNVQNGTIDLKRGELRPHRRQDFLTALAPVEFDPLATCPHWDSTLELVFQGDPQLIAFVQRLFGCALTGTVTEQVLPIFHGGGENGKSTLLTTLLNMLGADYAMKAPPGLLVAKRGETHPTESASLFGKRLVVAIETDQGARINESFVKELTGSDPITTRRMREDFWTFNPTHKVILCTNHKPTIKGTDHAIWRRLHLIPFDVKIPADRKDLNMPAKLAREYPGILAWCVRGCRTWQAKGLEPPVLVTQATEQYRKDQDIIGGFLEECCVVTDSAEVRVQASALYHAYKTWATAAGENPITLTDFGNRIKERGFKKKDSHCIWYLGIGLRANDNQTNSF